MAARKVLILGAPDGRCAELSSKLGAIQAKHGPFSAAFVVGDLFSTALDDDARRLLAGELPLAVPTYFYHGTRTLPDGVNVRDDGSVQQLAPNLYYLGRVGLAEVEGLRIAFCGGSGAAQAESTLEPMDAVDTLLNDPRLALVDAPPSLDVEADSLQAARAHAAALAAYAERAAEDAARLAQRVPVDFLFTNAWPKRITRLSSVAHPPEAEPWGVEALARLAEAVRPRYYFASAPTSAEVDARRLRMDADARTCGVFWEREPYENPPFAALPVPRVPPVTRFVSLAHVANAHKVRWFMALQVVPAEVQLANAAEGPPPMRPANLTPSPLLAPPPARAPPPERDARRYADAPAAPSNKRRKKGRREHDAAPLGPEQCWFCLSNPQLEKHLVVTIGEECYMALPKGQVPVSSDASTLVPGGGHVLLVPIAHVPSTWGPDASLPALRAEMRALRAALARCYAAYGAVPVSWEVVRRSHTRVAHTQTQVVPVPKGDAAALIEAFHAAARDVDLAFEPAEVAAAFDDADTTLVRAQDREDYCLIRVGDEPLLLLLRGERR
ncbi:hypothetical protein MBRA1_002779 [Malassezia brasiliensis]|uniref:Cwf19-like C-terminal domain-containing protein n=1 Tax=Malassezia brasiliensis TaxID=1821822 RepID=A0AAF0ITQ1_9BASI|nr:hypothetical protein MBRA1_002779 [Malassezia brasiliensis]